MQPTIKEQSEELIKSNFNQLLKVPVIPLGGEVMEKNRFDYLMILAKTISLNNINFILDNVQMTPEQSIYLKDLKIEILS